MPVDADAFDYVVVGSGPAGCVMAKTLSDTENTSVLLLEAGENNDRDALVASANANMYDHFPEYFWPGQTTPQAGVKGRSFPLTGGRLAGGGSSVNGQMYVRPSPYVLRQWARLAGPIWDPERVNARFRGLEAFHGRLTPSPAHGTSGRLSIRQTYPAGTPTLIQKLVNALEEASGLPAIEDYNDPATPIGPFARWQLYQQPDGSRASASVCFLGPDIVAADGSPIAGRLLRVSYKSTALRILFDDNRRATGVDYLADGGCRTAFARRKVIICAGFHSARLLMLSGVGPRRDLENAGLPVVYENPAVGRNLATHAYVDAMFSVNPADVEELRSDPNAKWAGGAFLPSPLDGAAADHREIEISAASEGDKLRIGIMFVAPRSRGTLRLQSSDPLKPMLGDPAFLSDPHDLATLKAVFRTYIAGLHRAFGKIDPAYRLLRPTPADLQDDDALTAYIRKTFSQSFHEQGHLRMGPESDGGVVDAFGHVYGVDNLVVADTSILPFHTDGNTSASAYIVGETLARHIAGLPLEPGAGQGPGAGPGASARRGADHNERTSNDHRNLVRPRSGLPGTGPEISRRFWKR